MRKEPIAIIGMGCRFPGGVRNPQGFWTLLQAGKDAITEVPDDRWNLEKFYDPDPTALGKMSSRWGGFLDQFDQFDASFFGISRLEAARMDPQQRLLLEVTWEALEDGGQVPAQLAKTEVGVFIGLLNQDYSHLQLCDRNTLNAHTRVGLNGNMAPNRISYWFDFTGPSLPVDAACASSLVAVHLACSSLWQGDCPMALAGGVNILCKPEISIATSQALMLSGEGRCKSFDASADGLVRSEGVGVVVLKPLSAAISDGDPIYATIRGSALNQNGRGQSFTAPDPLAIQSVIERAYRQAELSPAQVQYVEAQGSGWPTGDEAEAQAIGAAMGKDRLSGDECRIGSVKTNIGHTEAAAGIASFIKATLAVANRQIPPSLHCTTPNPKVDWDALKLRVPQSLEALAEHPPLPLVGVNAFGMGGVNVHAILAGVEIPPATPEPAKAATPQLFVLSAKSPEALRALVRDYIEFLENPDSGAKIALESLCYSASVRRTHHTCRLALIADCKDQLIKDLKVFLDGTTPTHLWWSEEVRHPPQRKRPIDSTLSSIAQCYIQGHAINWAALYPKVGITARLPTYPWQRRRYWHESEASRLHRLGDSKDEGAVTPSPVDHGDWNDILAQWSVAKGDRTQLLIAYVQALVAHALECAPSRLDRNQSLSTLGLDSLMAVTLRNQIMTQLRIELPFEQFMSSPSMVEIAQACHERLALKNLSLPMADFDEGTEETIL